jgi:uncharacterized protein YjbI with pentapeptide repeats
MANPEHLKILKQGVMAWNRWRRKNPNIQPDLRNGYLTMVSLIKADLRGAILHKANLTDTDLSLANLFGANLFGANLYNANLHNANLSEANLSDAYLGGAALGHANLYEAQLRRANLHGANLRSANIRFANLSGADLSKADFRWADLWAAQLSNADLRQAHFVRANLSRAQLDGADASGARLISAELVLADLEKANLREADLRYSRLTQSNLASATLTGARLYGCSRDNWIIKNVECKYVYWDIGGKQRSPKDRDLEPGEFERLYAALPTIEYIFENGMTPIDPLIMDRVVQAIREKRPEFDIKLDSINARGLAPSIKFTVQLEEHKEPALEEVRKRYEDRIIRLEVEKERLYDLLGQAIDKAGDVRLITGSIVAMDNATVNIEQHIHNALELQRAVAKEPEESESFAKVTKKKALDIIGGVIEDIAKGQVKEAAKQIIELGKDLGPLFLKMAPAAYAFFKSMLG